jgi:Fe-S oxidoreductase
MLEGDPIRDLWRSEAVKESLDLCLGCKACKSECPVRVDMATYKAEFLAHHYETKRRPRQAYFVGHIDRWSRLASRMPWLANFALQAPGLRTLAAAAMGTSPQRRFPRFAAEPFERWFRRRERASGRRVLLWPDTFNNHFYPETARAAIRVLAAAGAAPVLPDALICCGRPLYDFGYLDEARTRLLRIIKMLENEIKQKTPIVFLEPSCLSVFHDELANLLPRNDEAKRLAAQCVDFATYLTTCDEPPRWRKLDGRALYQGHCHQKALLGTAASERLLADAGVVTRVLDAGCCGMAGSFGFEHVDVSRRIGERALLPAVRAAEADELVVAEGFSCREQIEQLAGRRAFHLAEVLERAL